jgi:hypothetical protein
MDKANMSKERPILFSAPMVRAILDGKKTQTRRALRIQPIDVLPVNGNKAGIEWVGLMQREPEPKGLVFNCKFGKPGDRLWVRETFAIVPRTAYRCSEGVQQTLRPDDDHDAAIYRSGWERSKSGFVWRPSIFMPRWASRITLEIVSVRVERLQNISQADAIAEGSPPSHPSIDRISREYGHPDFTRSWYAQLWEQINGAGSWEKNPFVWVVEFKIVGK